MNDLYYIFRIRLNQYTGEFHRKICAFLTGIVGEEDDGHSTRFIDDGVEENFLGTMRIEKSESGWKAPCRSEGNEVHLLFENEPTPEQIKIIKDRLPKFPEAYKQRDVYAEYIGNFDMKIEHLEILKVETKVTPLMILNDPKSSL